MKIFGFAHVYMVHNWSEIFESQLEKIKASGLYDKLEKIFVGLNSQSEVPGFGPILHFNEEVFNDKKVEILYYINKPDLYETLTLSFLHKFCCESNVRVFYIHTKGVSRNSPQCQIDWRNLMEYFVIEKHKLCLQELVLNDIVGVNWHLGEGYMNASSKKCEDTEVTPHFSGNFWWANSDYIKRLPPLYPVKSKYECEFWIGKINPFVAELWHSDVYHHRNTYASSIYIGKENIKYYIGSMKV